MSKRVGYFTISDEYIEKEKLFNFMKNVPGLFKQKYENDNEHIIYYMNTLTDNIQEQALYGFKGVQDLDIFLDKLILDNDYIKYVGKGKEEISILFDKKTKLPNIFGIWFKDDKFYKYEVIK